MTNVSCFFSEFLATAVLIIVIHAMNDKRNTPPPAGLAPLVLFFVILGIGASLGMETGALFMLLVISFLICCRFRYQPRS
jgi:aquaglyceroporin related protein